MFMTRDKPENSKMSGYRIGYARGKGEFRVYICFLIAIIGFVLAYLSGNQVAIALGIIFLAIAYYYFPLTETGKMRLGAGEHGIFIEGLGIIPWRAVSNITNSMYAIRTIEVNELNIQLVQTLPKSLVADWRSLPFYRLVMKLPWTMGRDNVIRINLEPFDGKPDDILAALTRNWRYFGPRS